MVMPGHRRRGIASLELGVREFNAGAVACYEAAGFAPTTRHLSKPVAPA